MQSQAKDLTSTGLDQQIREIWRTVLNMPEGREDLTFFDLEGQSISAVRIVARIEDELSIVVDVGVLFEDPDLAAFIRAVLAAQDPTPAGTDAA